VENALDVAATAVKPARAGRQRSTTTSPRRHCCSRASPSTSWRPSRSTPP